MDSSWRVKRQQSCSLEYEFRCGTGNCIRKTFLCDGKPQCPDKSDENSSLCAQLAKGCTVPKVADGTVYSLVDCSQNKKNCRSPTSSVVKVSCNNGYTIPLSVNESTLLECPTSQWNHYSMQCMKCGRSAGTSDFKQIGMYPTQTKKYPWFVLIYKTVGSTSHLICGGTLLTPKFVVTAAHCVASNNEIGMAGDARLFRVVAAPESATFKYDSSKTKSVNKIFIKKFFIGEINSYNENIALLKLTSSYQLDDNINVVCMYSLSKKHRDFPSDPILTVPGWKIENKPPETETFVESNYKMTDLKKCTQLTRISDQRFFTYDKFCLLFRPGGNTLQQSDAGSGIIVTIGGINYIYGIVSAKIMGHDSFSIVTNTTKQERWIRSIIADSMDEKCPGDEIKCKNGDCLSKVSACNGLKECEDGWDEDPEFCSKIKEPQKPDENTQENCVLPGPQEGTILQMGNCTSSQCKLQPKSIVAPFTLVKVICQEGFTIPDFGKEKDPSACFKGNFYPPLISCTKLCQPLVSESLELKCVYRGEIVPCSELLLPTTKATYKCKYQFRPKNPSTFRGDNICNPTGSWKDALPDCAPKCGSTSAKGSASTLISKGKPAKVGDYPWHVALYQDEGEGFSHICGGTILSPKVIVTAAHCVYQNRKLVPFQNLQIAAGKYFRDYSATESNGQVRNVRSVVIGELYTGGSTDFESDIALIKVDKNFELNNFILPACVDWTRQNIPSTGSVGVVVGWGLTEYQNYSSELLEAHLPYLDLKLCRKNVKEKDPFFRFLTHDKFCVEYINGTGTQEGDSGGGYTIPVDGLHYIYGIVSVKPRNRNTFAAFTNVVSYISWIKNIMDSMESN